MKRDPVATTSMDISIIICTRNHAESLKQTLLAIAACAVPADLAGEVLVVDNGSTDETRDVVLEAQLSKLSLLYIEEPIPGQCHARNRGLDHATGRVILYTDDDVRPPLDWIEGMCRPILSGEADAVAGGVQIAAHLEREWLKGPLRGYVASTDMLDPLQPSRMVGANMAFSRSVLDKVSGFDEALGPGALGFEDETLFSHQLLSAGYRLVNRLDVEVEHHFDSSRLTRASMLQIARRAGASYAYVAYHWKHDLIARPLNQWIKAALGLISWRGRHWSAWFRKPGITWQEWEFVSGLSFYAQVMVEARRPRRYDRQGLRPRVESRDHSEPPGALAGDSV